MMAARSACIKVRIKPLIGRGTPSDQRPNTRRTASRLIGGVMPCSMAAQTPGRPQLTDDRFFAEAVEAADLPGAVGLILDADGTRYARAFGQADVATGAPMRIETPAQIASMTKAIVAVGAMQLVEQGRLDLDAPIGKLLPELADAQVLTGFADDGTPLLRPAARPLTLRHLLTHTSGLAYSFIRPEALRWAQHNGMPPPGSRKGIEMPLLFDPGEAWEYSVGIDWAGLAIEAVTGQRLGAYLAEHVTGPLRMHETAFHTAPPPGCASVHVRSPEGGWAVQPIWLNSGDFDMGGGGLTSTAPDYARFLRMVLRGGELDGARVLAPETLAEMRRNQIGDIRAGYMGSAIPELAPPFDWFPDQQTGWGLSWLINPEETAEGRSPGSLAWAGIFNSYYWVDPTAGVAGVFVSQISPFGHPAALDAFRALERMAYASN
jgi:CubicO group peptidase (beta-lactamase class C family)